MTGKDAGGVWKTRLSLILGAFFVLGVCLLVRYFWGPSAASAEAARGQRVVPTSSTPASVARRQTPPARSDAPAAPAVDVRTLKVMAVVNGEQISRQDLARECLRRYGESVLETFMNRDLIGQECQRRGVRVTEQDVEAEIERTAGKFGLSKDRWMQMLAQERDISPDQYRRELIWPTLALRGLAAAQIEVTADELRRAYESEYGPKVKCRMIALTSRSKAEEVHAQAVAHPEQFGDLAKDYSEDTNSASARGLIPSIRKNVGDSNLERVAFGLKEGEVSPIVQVANQYLILKCEKHLPASYLAVQHVAQAEEQLKDRIRDQKMRATAGQLFQRLQNEAEIVNCYNDPQKQQQFPGVAAMINGRRITISELSEVCLARHGKEVLDGEIHRLILTQALGRGGLTVTETDIDREVSRAADAYGYQRPDGAPDVDRWLDAVTEGEDATIELYVRDAVWPTVALKKLVTENVSVTEEDMQKGFESNYGPRVEVLAVVLSSQRQAQTVWEMARDNPTDQFFGELAQQYSMEPVSRANYGKVPPIRRFGGQPLVEKEAFQLTSGELSGIIAVGDKYVILRCLGRTQPVVEQMNDEVREELHKDIYEKKTRIAMAREFEHLKDSAQIDNFLEGTSQAGARAPRSAASPAAAGRRR